MNNELENYYVYHHYYAATTQQLTDSIQAKTPAENQNLMNSLLLLCIILLILYQPIPLSSALGLISSGIKLNPNFVLHCLTNAPRTTSSKVAMKVMKVNHCVLNNIIRKRLDPVLLTLLRAQQS